MKFALKRLRERRARIWGVARRYGGAVGIAGISAEFDRQAVPVTVSGAAIEGAFAWDDGDQHDEWWPQGLVPARYDGRDLLIAAWYRQRGGARITVIDRETLQYRHAVLVVPGWFGRFRRLRVHAGGIIWWNDWLHVAGTRRGLFSFRLDDIIDLGPTKRFLGRRYILPARSGYRPALSTHPLRFSFVSLADEDGRLEMIAGEYGINTQTTRLVRYPFDRETGGPKLDESGRTTAIAVHDNVHQHMQGATIVEGTYYVVVSRGQNAHGHIYVGKPDAWTCAKGAVPPGPEDISYLPEEDRFFCQSEYPGRRYVFWMQRSTVDDMAT